VCVPIVHSRAVTRACHPACLIVAVVLLRREAYPTAYGVLNTGYGQLWFAGRVLMGVLYDVSLPALIMFSVAAQLITVPLLFRVSRRHEAA
jgi:hypothetical protein